MKEQTYWFYIYPQVFVQHTKSAGTILYNTASGSLVKSDDAIFNKWIDEVYLPQNLGVIPLSGSAVEECKKSLLDEAIGKGMVNLVDKSNQPVKPINLLPILNLQKDFEKYEKNGSSELLGDNVLAYLSQLNLFLLSEEHPSTTGSLIGKQLPYPVSDHFGHAQLSLDAISKVLADSAYSLMKNVHLLGGSISKYNEINNLPRLIQNFPEYRFHLWYTQTDWNEIEKNLIDDATYDIVLIPELINDPKKAIAFLSTLSRYTIDVKTHIYVTSSREYEVYNELFQPYDADFFPLYTGRNLSFFKENVYLNEEDILSDIIPMRKIFCNQKVNSNFFGTLNIYPDGSAKARPTAPVLGNIHHENIKDILFKELTVNTAWRRTRSNPECDDCPYRYLCPPPSAYEEVIGDPALCTVNKSRKE